MITIGFYTPGADAPFTVWRKLPFVPAPGDGVVLDGLTYLVVARTWVPCFDDKTPHEVLLTVKKEITP